MKLMNVLILAVMIMMGEMMGKPATYLVETADAESEPGEWHFIHLWVLV